MRPFPAEHSMARVCQVTGKKPQVGHHVSHANNKTIVRRFYPNLQYRRFWWQSQKDAAGAEDCGIVDTPRAYHRASTSARSRRFAVPPRADGTAGSIERVWSCCWRGRRGVPLGFLPVTWQTRAMECSAGRGAYRSKQGARSSSKTKRGDESAEGRHSSRVRRKTWCGPRRR